MSIKSMKLSAYMAMASATLVACNQAEKKMMTPQEQQVARQDSTLQSHLDQFDKASTDAKTDVFDKLALYKKNLDSLDAADPALKVLADENLSYPMVTQILLEKHMQLELTRPDGSKDTVYKNSPSFPVNDL